MKFKLSIITVLVLFYTSNLLLGQKKQTYEINGTKYIYNESYKTTSHPKVERSSSAKNEFLKSKGYKKVPNGYQIDHVVPLSEGGADQPFNMQLIPTEQHKRKTASEKASNSTSSTSSFTTPKYRSNSTYRKSNNYSSPTYNYNSGKTIYTGPKGGQYYINSNRNKTYIKKK